MSLIARLHIEDHSNEDRGSDVLSCEFGFVQEISSSGHPTSIVRGGTINITVRGMDDPEILQWMINQDSLKNGRIVFSGITSTGPGRRRRIDFRDAFLVNYQEHFTNQNDIVVHLTISARSIEVSGVMHSNLWLRGNSGD